MTSRPSSMLPPLVIVCTALVLGACAAEVGGDGDDPAVRDTRMSGPVEVLVADYDDRAETRYFLETDEGRRVQLHFDVSPGHLVTGDRLDVDGAWEAAGDLRVQRVAVTGVKYDVGLSRREPLHHRVAVMLLGDTRYTASEVLDQVNQAPGSGTAYIAASSLGIDTFSGDVFGPYYVDTSDCDSRASEIANLAKAAFTADGNQLDDYSELAFLIPGGSGCGWGGLGQVLSPGATRQKLTWYNNWFDTRVVSHELGHNLGMNHSHSTDCGEAIYNASRSSCTDSEYGHPHDSMGGGGAPRGHFSAPQKQYMGWLDACEDITAGGSAVFNLSPLEGSCGVRSLRIPVPGEDSFYYLEYRKGGIDDFSGVADGSDRVLLSVSSDGASRRPHMYLLDATPSNPINRDAWLTPGADYALPGGVQVRVDSIGEYARVEVAMATGSGATCRGGAQPPTAGDGSVGVGCGDACPDDPDKIAPGVCGCGVPDIDTDGDSTLDCDDPCPDDPTCGASGLQGTYYDNRDFTGTSMVRVDRTVNFSWGSGAPDPSMGADDFSVRWDGFVEFPAAGSYTFYTMSDDGVRLWVNDELIVDNWTYHAPTENQGRVDVGEAGPQSIRLEYFEGGGGATMQLRWSGPGIAKAVVPAGRLSPGGGGGDECPDDPDKTTPGECGCGVPEGTCGDECPDDPYKTEPGVCGCGTPDTDTDGDNTADCDDGCPSDGTKTDAGICGCGIADTDGDGDGTADCNDACPGDGNKTSPGECGCGVPEGTCSGGNPIDESNLSGAGGSELRFELVVPAGGSNVVFRLSPGTGDPDLYVRRGALPTKLAYDCRPYYGSGSEEVCTFDSPGTYHVMVRGYTSFTGWSLSGTYESDDGGPAGTGTGLRGTYYDASDFTSEALQRIDATVNFAWGSGAPDAAMGADTFSVRWEGEVEAPATGTYTFYTRSDDGVRLWIDGDPLVDNWTIHAPTENSGTIELQAGQRYPIRIDYFENGGGATMQLSWSGPGTSKTIIPRERLYPASGDGGDGGDGGEIIDVDDLSGVRQSVEYFELVVPSGASNVVFTLSPGSGDPDLYVRRGEQPTTTAYDCRPYRGADREEVCTFDQPGTYYVMVRGYSDYSGWTLTGTYSGSAYAETSDTDDSGALGGCSAGSSGGSGAPLALLLLCVMLAARSRKPAGDLR